MKKTIITLSIIVVVFAIVSFSVTFVLINRNKANVNNINKEQDNISEKVENNVEEKTIDLLALYDENDLIIEQITFNGIEILQIKGLKNKKVESKVNEDLKSRLANLKEKYPGYEIVSRVTGNFANIVSFYVYLEKKVQIDEDDYEYYYENYALNYELVTGELIKLEDVFTKDTNVIDIVRTQFYNQLSMYNSYDTYDEDGNKLEPISFEEELYKIVKEFMASDNTNFVISPSGLILYSDKEIAFLEFIDNTDKIVIYDKYKTRESIFERDDIGRKGVFTCVDTTNYNENFNETIIGYLEENFWCDIIETKYYGEIPLNIQQKIESTKKDIKADINKKIEEYREIARKNPDKFYVFSNRQRFTPVGNINYNTNESDFVDYIEVQNDQLYYYMTKEYYEKEYIKNIAGHYRYEYFYMVVMDTLLNEYEILDVHDTEDDIDYEILDYKYQENLNIYNLNTKERFNKLSDIFIDEYMPEYTDIIANEFVKTAQYREYDVDYDKALELLKEAKFNFTQYTIDINIEGYENLYLGVHYEDFPRYMFKDNINDLMNIIYN